MKVKYDDTRRLNFIKLSNYPNGVTPKTGDILDVTDIEARQLLKLKNGKKKIFTVHNERVARED